MPILFQINTVANSGSTGRITEDIGELAISKDWESYIAYGRGKAKSKSNLMKITNKIDFYFHALQTRFLDNHGLSSSHNTKRLIENIKRIKPDIIHLHNIHGYYLNYSLLFNFLSQTNIPVVWTLHDCWTYTGHCSHYTFAQCKRWKESCFNCPQKNRYPKSWFIDRSSQNYADKKRYFSSINNLTIITVSNWLENEVKQSFFKDKTIKTIHNGVNTKIFKPQNINKSNLNPLLNNKFIILGVANVWDKYKGLDDFIQLRKKLSNEYIIILIGLNNKQIKHLPEGIIGIQHTNNIKELAEYYTIADVYLNTSIEETFGMTTCESMACGTPVIVYNSTASPELVTNQTGFIVEPQDFNKIIKILEYLKKTDKDQYSIACRRRVLKHFDKNDKYIEYMNLYENIIRHENLINNNHL